MRPAIPRESDARWVVARPRARSSSARPGASRSIASRVASGVTSRGARPVPPVVTTSAARVADLAQQGGDAGAIVRDDQRALDREPLRLEQADGFRARSGPRARPAAAESLTVMTTA